MKPQCTQIVHPIFQVWKLGKGWMPLDAAVNQARRTGIQLHILKCILRVRERAVRKASKI